MTSFPLLYFYFRIIASKLLNFQDCFNSKEPFMATFSESRALTSRKYVTEGAENNKKQSKL